MEITRFNTENFWTKFQARDTYIIRALKNIYIKQNLSKAQPASLRH